MRRVNLSLTTPVQRDIDSIFPGEDWFLYWKTSASLWEEKISALTQQHQIVVPINWSFHSDTGDTYDFAVKKPETDLKRIVDVATKHGKKVKFLIGVTPVPFLPNGGVPCLLAKSLAVNQDKIAYSIVDFDKNINRLYSFFDTRLFQAYQKFVHALGEYFASNKITSAVWGMNCGSISDDRFKSFIRDNSETFDKAFARYLGTLKNEISKDGGEIELDDVQKEQYLINRFTGSILELYTQSAQEALSDNWEGHLDFAFLGGSDKDFIDRICFGESTEKFVKDTLRSIVTGAIPSSILLSPADKQGILDRQLQELIVRSVMPVKMDSINLAENEKSLLVPLSFFNIYEKSLENISYQDCWNNLGLFEYLNKNWPWGFKVAREEQLKRDVSSGVGCGESYFLQGQTLNDERFHQMIKIFMNGGTILLNGSDIPEKFQKKIDTFFFENSLEIEKVNFQTMIQNVVLGDGRFIIIEGNVLKSLTPEKRSLFWNKIVETFDLTSTPLPEVEGVDFFWRTRPSSANELNYNEIRRLSIYNSTSYKKKFKFKFSKSFVLQRIIDKVNAEIKSSQNEIDFEMWPGGAVSIDFGLFDVT